MINLKAQYGLFRYYTTENDKLLISYLNAG